MIRLSQKLILLLCAPLMVLALQACVDQDFDAPPAGGTDPNLTVNITIAELKARHTPGQFERITDDVVFSAIVISNDFAGNFYKQLVVQDETGGIEMRIDQTDLHSEYAVGRKVYVKAKGLWLGDYNDLIQLGASVDTPTGGSPELSRIPTSLVKEFIVSATYGNPAIPKVKSIDELTTADVSTLIQINDVQFISSDAGQTYADPILHANINRDIEDCSHYSLIVRNSGYAAFAGELTPTGGGSITGILGIYRGDFQFMIRDLQDVNMTGPRCVITINESFNSINNDQDVVLPDWTNIATKGNRVWRGKVFSGNHYAQATAFGDTQAEMETWMITPDIVLNVPKKITFESAKAFWTHQGLSVWISSNFNGTDVNAATWTELHPNIAEMNDTENEFVPSGDIDLSGYTGTVRVGFKYVGSGPGGLTTSCRIDNVKVENL